MDHDVWWLVVDAISRSGQHAKALALKWIDADDEQFLEGRTIIYILTNIHVYWLSGIFIPGILCPATQTA